MKEGNQVYNSDKPINTKDEDLLNRAEFSRKLGRTILSYVPQDNIVIGLYGKWGSGKTSIINMAINEIKDVTQSVSEDKRPIIMKFSPWNYNNCESLISQFFNELRKTIAINDYSEELSTLGRLLEDYADIFELIDFLPGGKITSWFLKAYMKSVGGDLQEASYRKPIEEVKCELEKALTEQKHRIIVVIDDIDRLTSEQIRTIVLLVKQVAGLPNITYLLSMDRDIVAKALSNAQGCDGYDYLEKIIQVPFIIPQINKNQLQGILFESLGNLMEIYPHHAFNENHWQRIYEYCIKPYIKSIRDINRICNTFHFKFALLHSEVDFADLLGITVLELFEPSLAEWISHNKECLCKGRSGYYVFKDISRSDIENNRTYFNHELDTIHIDKNRGYMILSALFPVFSRLTGDDTYRFGDKTDLDLRGSMRAAASERFDLYFQLDTSLVPIRRESLKDSINIMNENELVEMLHSNNENNSISFYLDEMQSFIPKLSEDRILVVIRALVAIKCQLLDEKPRLILVPTAKKRAEVCIELLLKQLKSKEKVAKVVNQILKSESDLSVVGIVPFIYSQEVTYGRIGSEGVYEEKCLVTEEQLNDIERNFCKRMISLLQSGQLFYLPDLDYIAALWSKRAPDSFSMYFIPEMRNIDSILCFISSIDEKWSGSGDKNYEGWSISLLSVKDYVDERINIYDEIDNYSKSDLINKFNQEDLQKIATFVLNRGERQELGKRATIEEADKLIEEWKESVKL